MSTQKKCQIFLLGLVAAISLYSCKDEFDLPYQPIDSYTSVYMPQVVNGPVISTLKIKDIVQTATYGAIYGGQNYPTVNVPVSFAVDNSLVAAYNTANKTNYAVLPASAYTLSAINSVIPKGKTSTEPLSISFKTIGAGAMEAMKTYLLPLTLSCPDVKVNQSLKTAYYIVKAQPDLADYPNYLRSGWTIIGFSSQEANGEGPNNGRAIFALDGDNNTFWHTQWQGASSGPPHFLTIDMGETKTIHGIAIMGRQADVGGKPNEVNVQVSTDGVVWSDGGTFNLQNNKNLQSTFLPNGFKSARYFKVIVNSAYNGNYTQVAELYAF